MWQDSFYWITWMKMSWIWVCVTSPGYPWKSWWVSGFRYRCPDYPRKPVPPGSWIQTARWVQYHYSKLRGYNRVQDFWNLNISMQISAESVWDIKLVYRWSHTLLVWTSDLLPIRKGLGSRLRQGLWNFRCQGFKILAEGVWYFMPVVDPLTQLKQPTNWFCSVASFSSFTGASSSWYETGSVAEPTGNTASKCWPLTPNLIPRSHVNAGLNPIIKWLNTLIEACKSRPHTPPSHEEKRFSPGGTHGLGTRLEAYVARSSHDWFLFVSSEPLKGSRNIWWITVGVTYPNLQIMIFIDILLCVKWKVICFAFE